MKNETIKLSRDEVLKAIESRGCRIVGRAIVKVCDHKDNPLAPERYCYKVYFHDGWIKRRVALWPNTVGAQGF